jgi:hypothetical protein
VVAVVAELDHVEELRIVCEALSVATGHYCVIVLRGSRQGAVDPKFGRIVEQRDQAQTFAVSGSSANQSIWRVSLEVRSRMSRAPWNFAVAVRV